MLLEVIATTLEEARQACRLGADRLELVMGMRESGLTPSFAMVEAIKQELAIELAVMIRPHAKSFCYSADDLKVMKRDIELFKGLGVDSFVMGALDEYGHIDVKTMQELLECVGHTPVVFHRAFDQTPDYHSSLRALKELKGVKRLLTSFGASSRLEDWLSLRELCLCAQEQGLTVVWGGGVTQENVEKIISDICPNEIHVGSAVRLNLDVIANIDAYRLSEPSYGEVILDGISLKQWNREIFTHQIGMVFQDSVLFSGTLRANLGSQELKAEAIEKALKTAQLWDYVSNLPQGLQTPLSERAQDLSGGQRQRLMLARAIVGEPRLLFLDDFVARLDIKTAHEVVSALKENYPHTMIFEIAQDLKIAPHVDWVLLMMEGELLAQGTHKDLLASSWEYRELLSSSQGIEDEGL
ncbi:UNVERIFIED_CONTAM: hypothetical protein PYX00_011914 [Menopon gallinae]|uniref:Copper homeostasis protein cutC homolog n=1 Tax=Menopon gallinae TaxID=328185 RepID=A0AAW2H901_9NEOP